MVPAAVARADVEELNYAECTGRCFVRLSVQIRGSLCRYDARAGYNLPALLSRAFVAKILGELHPHLCAH